ncbi:DNA repair protein RecO [Syntrophotalea carbinolica DSM 2380]|uniref:DNA repair protein RecO n=1 Tax=Syntrophotalea carbinolica (strain DSM 2380 / NBRC 103641 / GraBd1) TaxID=338963 RepID=RECO_SYNC1|nr:DNA repair protein RecO [Syntrophotalea carbinolica]Q3A8N7.1 RecName: Full=DNA repair protein RecO; AltName: Full=Recombination protein O [Syntrophotalea carbinolica DSM 2380]ABA87856.1 DNA repair protein RecO [Syntrophotalea carbinolica DSM 2380]
MENCSSDAVVLHHFDYGEADRIVTLFSLEKGLIKGIARQARKSRKRFGAALEPFSTVHMRWQSRSGRDLVTLQDAELIDLRSGLRHNLLAMALAAYGCELVENLVGETGAQPPVYDLLTAFLTHVNHHGGSEEARLLLELRLLCLSGYAPHLVHCCKCGASFTSETVAFAASLGGSLCLDCVTGVDVQYLSLLSLGSLARALKAPLALFEGFRFGSQTLQQGGQVVSSMLRQQLTRPVKSLSFLSQLTEGSARVAAIR